MTDSDEGIAVCGYLDAVREVAVGAGRRILEVYDGDFDVVRKEDGSPLTEADRAAHRHIVQGLGALTPEVAVFSEESRAVEYAERRAWPRFWLVDPLDGTREFVKRNGEFTVNIAFIEGRRPLLGVVHVPVTGVTYYACAGVGAFRQDGDEPAQPIQTSAYAGGTATVVASRSHAGSVLPRFFERLREREGEFTTTSMGSSLKLCLVAEGRADVYPRFGPTSEWDTAAAQCVVECAGGAVTDLHGHRLEYNKPSILNPWFIVSGGGYDWIPLVEDLVEGEE